VSITVESTKKLRKFFASVDCDGDYFRLDLNFLKLYEGKKPNFGFNGLGEFVFHRTYSRIKDNGAKESFLDTLVRVVEGCYEIQRRHCTRIHIPWDYRKAQRSAQEMFQRMWDMKFLPPGRGLWMMGTEFMWTRGSAALNNCGFVSTRDISSDAAEPFCFLMDMSMLGVGVGFDTKGAGKLKIKSPADKILAHVIDDSREGWTESLKILIESYTDNSENGWIDFDYSGIRPEGTSIKGFGGHASGPDILEELHNLTRALLDKRIGGTLSSVDIVDIMNYIGRCIVAGNVRRTAEIAFGEYDDHKYYIMKNPTATLEDEDVEVFKQVVNKLYADNKTHATIEDFDGMIPEDRLIPAIKTWNALNNHRWASNNSIFAKVGMDYESVGEQIAVNGEPGLAWLDNMRDYGRMVDGKQPGIDGRVMGGNPCLEQSLESYELCCLVETFPANHDDASDYFRTLKFAYLYAKTVTLLPTHNPRTNQVMLRNRRIGLSQSGIIQAFAKFGRRAVLSDFCDSGYNEIARWDDVYSEWLCVQNSIKKTSVKPSGTVSLLAGATPGIHHPEASTYWRRIRVAKDSELVDIFKNAGYHIEPLISDPDRTVVVKFGVTDERVAPVGKVTIWEQMANVVDYQRYWADNQVSCTVKFKSSEADQIARVLTVYEDQLKGISFLPHENHGYVQAPYEPCTAAEVDEYNSMLKSTSFETYTVDAAGSKFCDGDRCEI
jgi:adenosylcobalamin-dependent ribonucleoside-triphosphate reductase